MTELKKMSDSVELLFFDTFSHENSEELNLDLVQFPKPVVISEVRVIPLGARVQADFPGGVRLGATNPSQFSIEFFVNDLGKRGASTFESLGGLEYNQNGCIHLECGISDSLKRQIPTDGLVLRGWYTTITLAVYGTLTRVITEPISVTGPPPALPQQAAISTDVQQQILTSAPTEQTWPAPDVNTPNTQMDYSTNVPVVYGPPPTSYPQSDVYPQEYPDYYNDDTPKDPRSYHHSETEWDSNKAPPRSLNTDSRSDATHSRRDRMYSRSHSRDRDYRENSRDSSDYEGRLRDRSNSIEYRDKGWDRYKHQDVYKRSRDRDHSYDREESRKRPRTPPIGSSKRPHTPHADVKDLSPGDVESISEEEMGGGPEAEPVKFKHGELIKDSIASPLSKTSDDVKGRPPGDEKLTPVQSPTTHNEESTLLDIEELEPILSDEDICDEGEPFPELDYDYSEYVNNDDLIKLFNPFNADVQHFARPSLLAEINDFFILKPEDEDVVKRMESSIIGNLNKLFDENGAQFNQLYNLLQDININMLNYFTSNNSGDVKEEWVQMCDQIPALVENNEVFKFIVDLYLYLSKRKFKDADFIENNAKYKRGKSVLITLLDWVKIGLNFEFALSQMQPGFKIRHIKSGIRLTEALCEAHATELLVQKEFDIQQILIELYHKEYMALSIKLMILKALDSTLWSKHGIEYFVSVDRLFRNKTLNGYQLLIEMLNANPLVRVKFALNSILGKLNAYEVLNNIKDIVAKWLTEKYLENEYCCNTIPEKQIDNLAFLMTSVSKTLRFNSFSLSQPKRFLPVSAQFEISRNLSVVNVCYVLFEICNFLENSLILLTHRTCNNMASITNSILEIISEMLRNQQGLRYLCDNIETTNLIIRSLLHPANNEDEAQYSRAQLIGLELSYKLQSLYHVDSLMNLSKKYSYDYDSTEILDQLHLFYCLTFSNVGKVAVAEVLSFSNNLNCLLQFFNMINLDAKQQEKDENLNSKIKKSPGIAYVVDLIGILLIFANNVLYLETYGYRLLKIANNFELFEPSTCTKLQEIRSYLKPFEIKNIFSYEDISPLCDIIKNSIVNISKLPEELITCLRILMYLSIAPNSDDLENHIEYTELRYKYVILQLYSLDGVSNLSTILQKVCECFEQPYVHTHQLGAMQGAIVITIIYPCVMLIKKMLTNVIAVRNTQYKDLTTVPVLLQTFTLLNAFPSTSILYQKACQINQEIIEILLAYTQPVSEEVNENESLNKSLWTLMINEIFKYTLSAPYTFIPGLLIFSELLPLPFPILTKLPLTENEVLRVVNLRKLWSAHLHSQSINIQELINTLMASSYQPLLHLLRRVCIQLSDLAANSALMICRGILENVYNVLNPKEEKTGAAAGAIEPCNCHAARVLNFLASLLTHGAIKCAVMYLLRSNHSTVVKGDEKFPLLIGLFSDVLRTHSELSSHVQAQECVISVIQSLCDSEITLYNNIDKSELSSDIYLSNALPQRDMLQIFINTMVDHIMMPESSYTTILPIIRTFVLLTEHDYGFYHLQTCLEKKTKPFYNVFVKFTQNFTKDNADCLATLSATLEFLRICLSTEYMEVEPDIIFTPRSMVMSSAAVSSAMGLVAESNKEETENEDASKNPVTVLEKMLQETVTGDDGLEPISENLSGMLKCLNAQTVEKQEPLVEPLLPVPENLLIQFNGRAVFSLTNEITDERMSAAYWLSAPSDENDVEQDQVPCDLSEMCRQLLPPEVNLCRETDRICQVSSCSDQIANDPLKMKRVSLDQHRYMTSTDKLKRPFITPMRGRGFLRTPPQRGDPFRSRPPNTSRPPSLHVDDFVALETCGAQPTGPTGYNKLSREIMSVRGAVRGRGRAFASPERGSHFRQIGRGASIWPGAHLTESTIVTTLPQHFRIATDSATHFSTVRTTIRGRGIPRLREPIPVVRHVRTIPR